MPAPSPRPLARRLAGTVAHLRGEGRGWTVLALAVGWFFTLGLRFVVPALLPAIKADFTVSNASVGAAITVMWITYGVMQFPAGALVDRVGERRLLVASTLLAGLGLVGVVASPSFPLFLLATGAFGLGTGLYGPARGTVLTRAFPARDGPAFGAVLATGSLGAALLPAGATLLAVVAGWRVAIGVTVPAFLATAVVLWRAIPPRASGTTARTDGGVPAPVRAVWRAIRTRSVALAVLGATLMLFTFQGLTAFLTTFLVEARGLSEGTAGALFGLLFLVGAASQSAGGGLAERHGYGRVLAAVTLASVPPLVALPFLENALALGLAVVLVGVRLAVAPLSNAYIIALLPAEIRGTAWGLVRTGFFSIGAFGSVLVGAMADAGLFAEAILVLGGLTAVAGLVYLFLPPRVPA